MNLLTIAEIYNLLDDANKAKLAAMADKLLHDQEFTATTKS